MKKILVIKSHTREDSFCNALAEEYLRGAKGKGHEVKVLNLRELGLEKFLKYEHSKYSKLPKDLQNSQRLITWADHLVFVYPTWWATPPALLKVFIEIVFQSGFAYKYKENPHKISWEKKLAGKSARLISTMDAPPIFYKLFIGDPGGKMMARGVLSFCGVKPVKKNYFGSVKMSSEEKRKKWLDKTYKIGFNE